MKHKRTRGQVFGSLLALALVVVLGLTTTGAGYSQDGQAVQPEAGPYSYAFTYQGQLKNASGPVNGTCDFAFTLYDDPDAGTWLGSKGIAGVPLVDGVFTVRLDFGAEAHTGGARWLEIRVRCPAGGSGSHILLTPRQELTAAPAALALALPFEAGGSSSGPLLSFWNSTGAALELASQNGRGLYVSSAGSDGVFVNQAGSPTATTPSADPNGFEVAGAQGHGLWVGWASLDGVMIYATGDDGVTVDSAGDDGLYVGSAGGEGLQVEAAGGHGVYVGNAALHGLQLDSAGYNGVNILQVADDGVYVERAGTPATITPDAVDNGFEVAGAAGNGLYVGYAGVDGVQVQSAVDDGVEVTSAGGHGLYVVDADLQGVQIDSAAHDGVEVYSAGEHGLHVVTAADDGVYVERAGTPSTIAPGATVNGFEVAGALGNGLYVGRADQWGVYVHSAQGGVNVHSAGNNGLWVDSAGTNGLWVASAGASGVYVEHATTYGAYANTTNAAHEWGFYTPDKIYAGTTLASGGPLLVVAQNGDGGSLETGDLVAVSGVGAILPDAEAPLPLVWRSAADGSPVLGVVYGRLVVEEKVDRIDGEGGIEERISSHANSTDGPAAPGDYLLVVVLGAAQVKVEAEAAADLRPGDLLAAALNGQATKAAPIRVGETTFYAPGTVLGQVMGAAENGLIWVWVNPR